MENPGSQIVTLGTPNKIAMILFDGISGQRVGLQMSAVTIAGSTVTVYTPGGATLGSASIGTAGGAIGVSVLPTTGTYTIVVDPSSTNTGSMTLSLGAPDLTVSGLTVGAVTANPNGSYSMPVSFQVNNVGSSTAQPGWYDMVYLSTDAVLDNSDVYIGNAHRSTALAAGASYTVNVTATTSTATAPGTYTLIVKADARHASLHGGNATATDAGTLTEAAETNNTAATTVSLTQ